MQCGVSGKGPGSPQEAPLASARVCPHLIITVPGTVPGTGTVTEA